MFKIICNVDNRLSKIKTHKNKKGWNIRKIKTFLKFN